MPPLLTAIRSGANSFAAATARTCHSGSDASPARPFAVPPAAVSSSTTESTASPLRSVTSTAAPFAASRVAMARPMPEPAPVTIADRSATSYVAMGYLLGSVPHPFRRDSPDAIRRPWEAPERRERPSGSGNRGFSRFSGASSAWAPALESPSLLLSEHAPRDSFIRGRTRPAAVRSGHDRGGPPRGGRRGRPGRAGRPGGCDRAPVLGPRAGEPAAGHPLADRHPAEPLPVRVG